MAGMELDRKRSSELLTWRGKERYEALTQSSNNRKSDFVRSAVSLITTQTLGGGHNRLGTNHSSFVNENCTEFTAASMYHSRNNMGLTGTRGMTKNRLKSHLSKIWLVGLLLIFCLSLPTCSSDPHSSTRRQRDLPPDSGPSPGGPGEEAGLDGEERGFSSEDEKRLRRFVDWVRGPGTCAVPSISMAVVMPSGRMTSWASGLADIEHHKAADTNTLYCMASLSKAFTATLLASLLHMREMTLDVTVMSILGGKYPFMQEYVSNHVTVRDLLLHRTGIPRYDYLWISGAENSEAIFKRLRCMKHSKEFRTVAVYNNILYALAGHVAEEIGGASWETLLRQKLLGPIGMTSTTFIRDIYSEPYNYTKAQQYVWINGSNMNIGDPLYRGAYDIAPAIGVYSTARDMALWIDFHLSGGKNREGHQLVPRPVMEDLHRGQVSAENMMKPEINSEDGSVLLEYSMYGAGWFTGHHRDQRVIMHFGSYPGFYSMITLVPEKGFGIFTSINGGKINTPYSINSYIHTLAIDLALDIPKELAPSFSSVCKNNHPISKPYDCSKYQGEYTMRRDHLIKYTGTYANPAYGNTSLRLEDNNIVMTYNQIIFTVFPLTDLEFCVFPKKIEQQAIFFPRNISFVFNHTRAIEYISLSFLEFDNKFYKLSPDVNYEEWLNEKCGMQKRPCEKIEALPEIGSAGVALTQGIMHVFIGLLALLAV